MLLYEVMCVGVVIVVCNIVCYFDMIFVDWLCNWWLLIYCWCGGKCLGLMMIWFNLIGWKVC